MHPIRRIRSWGYRAVAAAMLLAGCLLLVSPLVGDWVSSMHSTQAIANYDSSVKTAGEEEIARQFELADEYNESLLDSQLQLTDPFDASAVDGTQEPYASIFNTAGDGVMGHVEIPKIDVDLPIYHGTSASALEKGAGHMANTSLPTGKKGTHAVITGHTGLTTARMFTDLSELEVGDVFYLHILDKTFAYQVDQIKIVEPNDSSDLLPIEGKDLVTLLTCYPYGINSHRLLVRGTRISLDEAEQVDQTPAADSVWKSEYLRAVVLCLAIYVPLTIAVIVYLRRRRKRLDATGPVEPSSPSRLHRAVSRVWSHLPLGRGSPRTGPAARESSQTRRADRDETTSHNNQS